MIGDMLETVKDADEIVVIVNGSTDKTEEIASSYGTVYTDYVWCDDFAHARNHAISKCTGDWILSIDCDNRLEAGGIEKIRACVEDTVTAINVTLWAGDTSHKLPWLFRNIPENRFVGSVHEFMQTPGPIGESGVRIEYLFSPAHALDPDRVLRICGKALEKNPLDARMRFYYAREFHYRGQYDRAIEQFDRYLLVSKWLPEKCDALFMLAQCYWWSGRGDQARAVCLEAIRNNPDFRKALLLMTEMHNEPWRGKWQRIAEQATNQDVLFT